MKNRYRLIIAAQSIVIILLAVFAYFQKLEADRQRKIVSLTEQIADQLQKRLVNCIN